MSQELLTNMAMRLFGETARDPVLSLRMGIIGHEKFLDLLWNENETAPLNSKPLTSTFAEALAKAQAKKSKSQIQKPVG